MVTNFSISEVRVSDMFYLLEKGAVTSCGVRRKAVRRFGRPWRGAADSMTDTKVLPLLKIEERRLRK